jgi:2-amino-4-hydroxy-6-hydroxymethyldihydropteridine diphosphokinase
MNRGIFLLLGTNKGARINNLEQAAVAIELLPARIVKKSSIYCTAAWGKTDQEDFYNQVIEIEIGTELNPHALLAALQNIEVDMGRVRAEKWGPRIIDIDILFFGNLVVHKQVLTIPHPGIPDRKFTLVPLNEIAPDFEHPTLKKTTKKLLDECSDPLQVTLLS